MNLKPYILSIIVLLCSSCSKDSTGQQESVQVNFATKIEMPTKVGEYFEAGEKLGLFGYNYIQGEDIMAPDYMYNVALEHTGDRKWSTQETYYWSPNTIKWKRFYAYYPFAENGTSENIVGVSPADHTGAPYVDFTFTDAKTDFMVCEGVDGNVENPVIQLTAKHALAKLSIGFATDIENGYAYAKALKVNGITKIGRYEYSKGAFTFDAAPETVDFELTQPKNEDGTDKEIIADSKEAVYVDEYTMYLLPNAVASIETVINGVPQTFDLSRVPLASGKNTGIRIIIDQKGASFKVSIGDWETGGSVNGTID